MIKNQLNELDKVLAELILIYGKTVFYHFIMKDNLKKSRQWRAKEKIDLSECVPKYCIQFFKRMLSFEVDHHLGGNINIYVSIWLHKILNTNGRTKSKSWSYHAHLFKSADNAQYFKAREWTELIR